MTFECLFCERIAPTMLHVSWRVCAALPHLLFGLFLLSSEATPMPWISYSQHDCHVTIQTQFQGAEVVDGSSYPISHPNKFLTLSECRQRCAEKEGCDGFMMRDIEITQSNCYLLKNIMRERCSHHASEDSTLYQNPAVYLPGHHAWASYPGTDCLIHILGAATEIFRPDVQNFRGASINQCETMCLLQGGCDAIMWKQIGDEASRGVEKNCWLLKDLELTKCEHTMRTESFEIRTPPGTVGDTSKVQLPKLARLADSYWDTLAGQNCCSGFGGDPVDEASDPLPGYYDLKRCQERCSAIPDCEGVVMRDTHDGSTGNCFLRKHLDLLACKLSPVYNVWIRPGSPTNFDAEWTSVAGYNCFPGAGAEDIFVNGYHAIQSHAGLRRCERLCRESLDCDAVVWRATHDGTRRKCFFRKNIVPSKCIPDRAWNVRLKLVGWTSSTTTTPTTTASTTTASTTATSMTATSTTATTTVTFMTTTFATALNPWHTIAGIDCPVMIGAAMATRTPGYDPFKKRVLLSQCQKMCRDLPECEAIVMSDAGTAAQPNCWLRRKVVLGHCVADLSVNLWFKPGVRKPEQDRWLAYEATTCSPGMGAELAAFGNHPLPAYQLLKRQEEGCIDTTECEALECEDTMDMLNRACYFRKHVRIAECTRNVSFCLRSMNPWYKSFEPVASGPWPTTIAKFCQIVAGALPVAAPGFTPHQRHHSLAECQALCEQQADCKVVSMRDVNIHQESNCWLFSAVNLANCRDEDGAAVWYKPSAHNQSKAEWLSYAARHCYDGHGAVTLGLSQNFTSGNQTLSECQKAYGNMSSCEAFAWRGMTKGATSSCELFQSVVVGNCDAEPEFNVFMKTGHMIRLSTPGDIAGHAANVAMASAGNFALGGASSRGCWPSRLGWPSPCDGEAPTEGPPSRRRTA